MNIDKLIHDGIIIIKRNSLEKKRKKIVKMLKQNNSIKEDNNSRTLLEEKMHLDNELEKLVEIYSTWGNQEYPFNEGNPIPPRYKFYGHGPHAREKGVVLEKKGSFVRDALEKGYKLGFTAGGDDHLGIFPSGPIEIENGLYKPGIMGLWAKELSRESLWEALHQRRCYGTTGPRVIIEFYLEQFFMGNR